MSTMIMSVYLLAVVVVASSVFSYEISLRGLNSSCKSNDDCHKIKNSYCSEKQLCECRLGYTIDGSQSECLKVANGYYDTCEDSVQCSRFLGVGGLCDHNKQCVCTENYHYLHGRCFETKGLDEYCKSDEECFVNADYQAASCKDGKCKCSEDFYQREYSACRPKAKNIGDECILDSDCTFDEKATCVSNKCALNNESVRLFKRSFSKEEEISPNGNITIGEMKCENDGDCKLINYSICAANNTCVCDRGYFPLRIKSEESYVVDDCVPEIGTACDPEESKSDLQVEFATCKNNVWACEFDRVALKDNRLCRKLAKNIGATCNFPEVCYLFGPRSECVDKKCTCDETSHWVNKEKFCWKHGKIDEGCKSDYDCYSRGDDYSAKCSSGTCTCPEGSIASDDGGYCYSSEPKLGSYCENADECKTIPNVSCENNKCSCAKTFFELEEHCIKGLNATCENDDDCKLENTACLSVNKTKICQCSQNFTVGSDNICIKKLNYKEECTEDVQCSAAVKNTFCNITTSKYYDDNDNDDDGDDEEANGHCDCLAGHYFDIDACYRKRKLGQDCKNERECFTKSHPGVCKNSICSCDVDFVQVGQDCKSKNSSAGLFFDWWLTLVVLSAIVATIP